VAAQQQKNKIKIDNTGIEGVVGKHLKKMDKGWVCPKLGRLRSFDPRQFLGFEVVDPVFAIRLVQ